MVILKRQKCQPEIFGGRLHYRYPYFLLRVSGVYAGKEGVRTKKVAIAAITARTSAVIKAIS